MIKGAIDLIVKDAVGGWVYSEAVDLRQHTVLAFVENSCVGAGTVKEHREDLVQAGLGDGYFGFRFPITLRSPDDMPRVFVKLENSDAILIQRSSSVVGNTTTTGASPQPLATRRTACLQWMRARNWITQPQYDFLTLIDQAGVYDRLLDREGHARPAKDDQTDLRAVTMELFELFWMENVSTLREDRIDAISDLPGLLSSLSPPWGSDLIVALWSPGRARLGVVEGSHLTSGLQPDAKPFPTNFLISPDRLLLVNARCDVEPRSPAPADGIHVFSVAN